MSDITFYEDSLYPERMSKLEPYDRSKLKLDFNSASAISPAKRNTILAGTPLNGPLLQSPDLMLLKLGSPELENMIMQNNGFITTTPTPTDSRMPKQSTTEEQEQFAAGFVLALQKLQQNGEVNSEVAKDRISAYCNEHLTRPALSYTPPPFSRYDVNANTVAVKQETVDAGVVVTADTSSHSFAPSKSWASQGRNKADLAKKTEFSRVSNQAQYSSVPDARQRSFYSQQTNNTQRLRHPTSSPLSVVRHTQPETGLIKHVDSTSGVFQHGRNTPPTISSGSYPVISAVGSVIKCSSSPRPQPFKIEDEAQIVPSNTPPLQSTPIDLKMQEIIKHERKKLRNRLAAQRCRKRKIEREDELKDKVKELKTENGELTNTRSDLRKQVIELKQKVMNHVNQGCHIFLPNSQAVLPEACPSPLS